MVENRRISRREFLKLIGAGSTILLFGGLGLSRMLRSASALNFTNSGGGTSPFGQQRQQLGPMVNRFMIGANYGAWDNRTTNIGRNQFDPNISPLPTKALSNPSLPYLSTHPGDIDSFFSSIQGLDVVRLWILNQHEGMKFEPGTTNLIEGLDDEYVKNLKMILDSAAKHNVQMYLTLVEVANTAIFNPGDDRNYRNIQERIMSDYVKNPYKFIINYLAPLIDVIGSHPALYGIDLMNKPEMVFEAHQQTYTYGEMLVFCERCTAAIHQLNSNVKVSCGCMNYSTAMDMSAFLDFADVHVYTNENLVNNQDGIPFKDHDIKAMFKGKSVIIGECGLAHANEKQQSAYADMFEVSVNENLVTMAKELGYSATMTWGVINDFGPNEGFIFQPSHRQQILDFLKNFSRNSPPSTGIIHGAMTDISGNENLSDSGIKSFNSLAKKPIGIAYFTHHWFKKVEPFPQTQCDIAKANSCVPFIRMNADMLQSTVVNCAAINSGKHDSELQAYAQAAKAWGGTILAEIGTEVNGNFLAFSGEGSAAYKTMARKVITMFKQIAPNVRWVFHGDYNDLSSHPEQWYPGDDLFDWIGSSFYGQSNGKGCIGSLEQNNNQNYNVMANTGNKPLAILEWGIANPTDITNTMTGLPQKFPRIKMLLYWNEQGSFDRRINKTQQSLTAYQQGISSSNYTSTYYDP
jgi:hypothetical protein